MQGVIAAVPTPYTAEMTPQKAPFLEHCSWALANGCDGLNVLGSTGEANSLSHAARLDVMGWAATGLETSRLMVGTGTPALHETIALTRAANDLGYAVALVLPPYYYKPLSNDALIAWYMAVDAALGDAKIQIYFYNFPQMTGLTIPVEVIAALAAKAPKRFTGIKDSSGDLDYCRAILAANGNLRVFPSSETALADAHKDGFAGCISATTNITAELCGQAWAQAANPPADTLATMGTQRATIAGAGLIPAIKYLVGVRSGDAIWRHIAPPFLPLSDTEGAALETALNA